MPSTTNDKNARSSSCKRARNSSSDKPVPAPVAKRSAPTGRPRGRPRNTPSTALEKLSATTTTGVDVAKDTVDKSVDATQAPKEVTPVGSLLETKKLDAVTLWQLTREKVEASLAQRVKKENAAMALADLSSSQASSLDDSTIAATESTLTSSSANSLLPADEPLAGAPTSSSQSSADAARAENLPNLPSKDAVTSVDSHSTVTAGLSISTATFPATCPQKTIQLLLRIEATMCALAYDVDLCKNTWAPRHTLLVDYILRLMQKPSIPERVFLLSARARTACATFTKTHLGGPFGKFINHVLRRYRNETALFLSRWPSTLMPIVHSAYLRPMVYEYLRTLMQTYDLEPFDSDIVAAARQLRAARH